VRRLGVEQFADACGEEAAVRRLLLVDAHADNRVEKTSPTAYRLNLPSHTEPCATAQSGKGTLNPGETAKVETSITGPKSVPDSRRELEFIARQPRGSRAPTAPPAERGRRVPPLGNKN
jgi:hypothetical protein